VDPQVPLGMGDKIGRHIYIVRQIKSGHDLGPEPYASCGLPVPHMCPMGRRMITALCLPEGSDRPDGCLLDVRWVSDGCLQLRIAGCRMEEAEPNTDRFRYPSDTHLTPI